MKFHFGREILYLKSRLYVKSRFVKSRLYCITLSSVAAMLLVLRCFPDFPFPEKPFFCESLLEKISMVFTMPDGAFGRRLLKH